MVSYHITCPGWHLPNLAASTEILYSLIGCTAFWTTTDLCIAKMNNSKPACECEHVPEPAPVGLVASPLSGLLSLPLVDLAMPVNTEDITETLFRMI